MHDGDVLVIDEHEHAFALVRLLMLTTSRMSLLRSTMAFVAAFTAEQPSRSLHRVRPEFDRDRSDLALAKDLEFDGVARRGANSGAGEIRLRRSLP